MKNNEILFEVKGIKKWFGKVQALKGVDLTIRKGEAVAMVGDNGAGKSTLVKIISGVIPATEGEIYFEGEKVNINSVDKARKLGIETVHQDRTVIGNLNVFENIFLTRELYKSLGPLKILDKTQMKKETAKLTESLGLKIPSVYQEIRFCSGGERQGVSIARVVYFDAKLVILDEPTTALSARGVSKLLNFLEHLRQKGISLIYVTHDLATLYRIADRFIIIIRGKVASNISKEETTLEELKNYGVRGFRE